MADIPPGVASIFVATIGAFGVAWASWFAARRTSQRERQKSIADRLAACLDERERLEREKLDLLERLVRRE